MAEDKTSDKNPDLFDFDYWLKLYEQDPVQAEAFRAEVIEKYIQSASSDKIPMLHNLQSQINALRKNSDPLMNAENMCKLMAEKNVQLDELFVKCIEQSKKHMH